MPQGIVDVHAHCLPRQTLEALEGLGQASGVYTGPSMSDSDEDIGARLAMMDQAGVDRQLLALPPLPPIPDRERARDLAALSNDALLAVAAAHPERFGVLAALPLPHLDLSIAELDRALGAGADGLMLPCSCEGISLAGAEFEAILEHADRSATLILWHPVVNGICAPLFNDYQLAAAVGTSVEDTLIVLHCITRNINHRFPYLRMIVPHLGGLLPMLMARLDNQLVLGHAELPEPPSDTVKRFWFDTVAHGSTEALRCACDAYGAERLLPGSDYPYLLRHEQYEETFAYIRRAGLTTDQVQAILEENALTLLGKA